ncbi:MAG TPA: hypothetical protein VMU22_08105, partial [Rhizomicrobium sp.]|nr:hypothetical protein [Rhizomicrobium sp.]
IGPGGYQLGHFPPGFSEWNDRYRDGLRKYWRGDGGMRPEVAARLTGSGDIFDTRKRKPFASINYMASHDGFTLEDVVSYEAKHNEANGEDNRDGQQDNYSVNYGAEGPTDNPDIVAYRERVKRSMLTGLFGSLGTPMLLMGDECGRTQKGNNNAYCQDNEVSWFDWKLLETENGRGLADFVARLLALRRRFPTLRCGKFLSDSSDITEGLRELSWYDERGVQLSKEDWDNTQGRVLILRRAEKLASGAVEITALMLNADSNTLQFKLPGPYSWRVLIDSGNPSAAERVVEGETLEVVGRGAVVLAAEIPP